jgi:hypothetical protein
LASNTPQNETNRDLISKDEGYKSVGCALEVLNCLGHGLHENPYENALVVEFGLVEWSGGTTGYRAEILARIPGSFEGSRTINEYFLMAPLEDTQQFDRETQAVRWASGEEARLLIQLNEPKAEGL